MRDRVNILGTEYKIEIHKWDEDKELKDNSFAGYCADDYPLIVISDMDDEKYIGFINETDKDNYAKTCLRHEIIHAYLNESGLKNSTVSNGPWAKNEEMVDWIAQQAPKIFKTFTELGLL